MARFRIREEQAAVAIEVTEVGGRQAELLGAFQECQEGRCDCPTDEYSKVSTMAVEAGDDQIRLRLEAKPGDRFDTSEIAGCLEHTVAKVTRRVRSG